MSLADDFRQAIEALEVNALRRLWRKVSPHLPQPDDTGALVAAHMARTAANSVPLKKRAYSHQWLCDRGLPSQMPDRLRPSAERLYPVVQQVVGISVNSKYEIVRSSIRGRMEDAVNDCYANGDTNPTIVKAQMMEARKREQRALGLNRRVST